MGRQDKQNFQPYFSFEQDLWAQRDNCNLIMNRFERFLDQPVVARGVKGSPDEHRVMLTNVIRHRDRFMMWYTAMRPISRDAEKAVMVTSMALACSDDGIHWEKPDLNGKGRTSRKWADNVLVDLSKGAYNLGVARDGDRFIATHSHPQKNVHHTTFMLVTSEDGIHWKGSGKPCITSAHFETACSLFKFKSRYIVLGQGLSPHFTLPGGQPCGRVMFAYSSKDLKTWKLHREPAYAYPVPKYFPESAVQNHAGCSPVDRGRIAIGMMGQFWPGGFSETVRSTFGLVYSYDGTRWVEPFIAEPLLMPDEKSWDSGMLLQGYGIYSRGDTTYYWYSGLNGGNLWWPHSSAGCIRMRRDGFAHYVADGSVATLMTKAIPITSKDQAVYVNVQASSANPVRVRMLTEGSGAEVLGEAEIRKSGVMELALPIKPGHGKKICLQFQFGGKAKLYAFYTGPAIDTATYLADWSEQ